MGAEGLESYYMVVELSLLETFVKFFVVGLTSLDSTFESRSGNLSFIRFLCANSELVKSKRERFEGGAGTVAKDCTTLLRSSSLLAALSWKGKRRRRRRRAAAIRD